MQFVRHSELEGLHAPYGASNYHWMNYTPEKLATFHKTRMAAARGTELHELAARLIKLGVELPRTEATLNQYVNDALGFRMSAEVVLFATPNFWGTADAVSFRRNRETNRDVLRVSDLKTGVTATSEHQLEVYAAFFCIEYNMKPFEMDIELRIYQNDEVRLYVPDPDFLTHLMDKILTFDRIITEIRMEAS